MNTALESTRTQKAVGAVAVTGLALGGLTLMAPQADAQAVVGGIACDVVFDLTTTAATPPIFVAPAVILPGGAPGGAVICVAGSDCTMANAVGGVEAVIVGTPGNDTIFASPCDDLVYGGGGNDQIFGLGGSDTLAGGTGNDSLSGGGGDDELHGGGGNDTLHGNDGDDTLFGGAGNDNINGENGDDCMLGGGGNDELYGWNDNDFISGDGGNDFVQGNDGADIILGGDGADTIRGNDGADDIFGDSHATLVDDGVYLTALAADALAPPAVPAAIADIDGAFGSQFDGDNNPDCVPQQNTVLNVAMNGYIAGGFVGWPAGLAVVGFNDDIRGGDGDDEIRGEAGSDTIFGDDGDDTVFGEGNTACSFIDGIDLGDGTYMAMGFDAVPDCVDLTAYAAAAAGAGNQQPTGVGFAAAFAAGVENEVDYFTAAGNDSISGNDGDDSLMGGGGNDNVRGNADDDHLEGGNSFQGGIGDLDQGTTFAGGGALPGGGLGAGTDRLDGGSEWDACDPDVGFVSNCEIVFSFV